MNTNHSLKKSTALWALLLLSLALGATGAHAKSKRSKRLDLDGFTVESLGKRPIDSLTLDDGDNGKRKHLYRKRSSFLPETRETLQQARYNP